MFEIRKSKPCVALILILVISLLLLTSCSAKGEEVTTCPKEDIKLGDIKISLEEGEFQKEVRPENPQGYYTWYEEYEGYRYYVMQGTIKNDSQKTLSQKAVEVTCDTDGKEREGKLLFSNLLKADFLGSISSGNELPCTVFVLVKEDETPKTLHFFYNKDLKPNYSSSYDYCVDVNI